MTLNLYERLTLLNLLPQQVGSFSEMRNVRKVRKVLELDEATKEEIDLRMEGDRILWDNDKASKADLDTDLSEGEMNVIAHAFLLMEDSGNIPTDDRFADMYDKFESEVDKRR